MLHAGFILRFTLVCIANQHLAIRLPGFSPAIGVNQAALNQERSRTAGRVLQVRADRSVLEYVTGGSNAARRASGKARSLRVQKKKAGVMLSGNTMYNKPEDGPV